MVRSVQIYLPLVIAYLHQANGDPSNAEQSNSGWNYDKQGADWVNTCKLGERQSPIALSTSESFNVPLPRVIFEGYDTPITPLTLVNNGHSVNLAITDQALQGQRPFVTGGLLKSKYRAVSLHFHWGSNASYRGSEHTINGQKYDVEMHIVHQNVIYPTLDEAKNYPDGIVVLGVMLKSTGLPDRIYPGLNKIFNRLPEVTSTGSQTTLTDSVTLGQLIGDLNTREFFKYDGSLTTPECEQAVTWIVFPNPLPIAISQIAKFWSIQDDRGLPLVNNYRLLQPRNNRAVFYRNIYIG